MRNLILLFLCLFATVWVQAQPSVSFVVSSQTISEGIGTFQIAVTISNPDANPTSVDINVTGGNAVYGTNFIYGPVTVTFPASSPFTQLFTVTVYDDSIIDGDKSVIFSLANPTNSATIVSPSQFTLTMVDVDTPAVSMAQTTETQFDFAGQLNVPVTLSRGVRDTTKVQLKLVPGGTTAVKNVDFYFNDTTLLWPPDVAGIINGSITLINNPFFERDRQVEFALSGATNGGVIVDTTFTLIIPANPNYTEPGCSDLFFGQYIEGTGNNKAVQVFNPTAVPIDLSVYSILISANGGTNMTVYPLSGSIGPNGVFTVANPGAAGGILSVANATPSFLNFDGTDAVALLHNNDTIDVIGQLHVNPGVNGWAAGTGSTYQHTLIRGYYDHAGDTSWTNAANTWYSFPVDMIDSVGFHHTAPCGTTGPNATVRFVRSGDTVLQTLQFYYNLIIEIYNPTSDILQFDVAADPARTTAVQYYGNDYLWTNHGINAYPGITYDTLVPLEIFDNPEMSQTKKVTFEFINLPGNLTVIPDSIFTLYLINHNQFIVSFLGAGYSYPKGSGLVEIPLITSTFSPTPSTADVSISSGNAVLGQDYLFNDTTVTFPANSTDTQGVWVEILNNNLYEANKQINFNLSNPTNSTYSPVLGITGFTLTIINNDSLAGIPNNEMGINLNVFPNPVSNSLIVETDKYIEHMEILDVVGHRIVTVGPFNVGKSSVDVSSLSPGTYFFSVNGKTTYFKKFVKVE